MLFHDYLLPLFFLIAIILFLGGHYWKTRNPKTIIHLASLISAVSFTAVQFLLNVMHFVGWNDSYATSLLTSESKTILPQGLTVGLLMGFTIHCLQPFPLFSRIVCTLLAGSVIFFTVLGLSFFEYRQAVTNILLGLLLGALLGILQVILFPSRPIKDKLKFDTELPA